MIQSSPWKPTTSPGSAIILIGCSLNLLATQSLPNSKKNRFLMPALGMALIATSFANIVMFHLGIRFSLDYLYVKKFLPHLNLLIDRISPPPLTSSLEFLLLGLAILTWSASFKIGQVLVLLFLSFASLAMIGHAYGVEIYYSLPTSSQFEGISFCSAAAFILLGSGLLLSRPEAPLIRMAFSRSPVGELLKHVALGGIIALFLFSMMITIISFGFIGNSTSLQNSTTFILLTLLATLIWSSVRSLHYLEKKWSTTQELLERAQERLLYAQNLAQMGYWDWNLISEEIQISEEIYHLAGLTPDRPFVSYNALVNRVHPEDRHLLNTFAAQAIRGKTFFSLDFRILKPDGEVVFVNSQAKVDLDQDGLPYRVRGTTTNITKAKRAELELLQNKKLLQLVIESLPVGVWILNKDGEPSSSNPESQKIWGGRVTNLNSLRECEAWCEQTGKKMNFEDWGAYRALHYGETSIGSLIKIHNKDDSEKFILSSAIPLYLDHGQVTGAVMVHEDVTKQRQAESEVKMLLEKANEAVRVREDVLFIVSHDLKNPLTAANLSLQLLQRQLKNLPEHAALNRGVGNIKKSIDNMKNLIQSVLDMSKIQSGTFFVEPTTVSVKDLLVGIGDVMQPIAVDRQIKLSLDSIPANETFTVDRNRILQVLMNLVGNALKFTPPGGEVRLRCQQHKGQHIFEVQDNGPGIPQIQLKKIFERNWQSRSTDNTGNGLGLFIAKGIVEAHGGRIWVESKPGFGSHFFFSIPEMKQKQQITEKDQAG